jgi:hypothetical protein
VDLKRKASIVLLFLSLFGLGFGREFVFETLNEVLGNKYAGYEVDYIYSFSHWLNQFSYWPLYYSKWVLTVVVSLLFLGLSLLTLWVWHRKISYVKIALFFFLGIYSLSTLIFGMGWLIGELDQFFKLTRMLMEIPQSPLLIMFLIPSLGLLPKS